MTDVRTRAQSPADRCPVPPSECNATYQFTCKNKFCKPLFWVCDSVNDCGDNSDELQCSECLVLGRVGEGGCQCLLGLPATSAGRTGAEREALSPGCPAQTFQCGNGKCVPQNQQCDGTDNCGDGSDEATCDRGETWPSPPCFRGFPPGGSCHEHTHIPSFQSLINTNHPLCEV